MEEANKKIIKTRIEMLIDKINQANETVIVMQGEHELLAADHEVPFLRTRAEVAMDLLQRASRVTGTLLESRKKLRAYRRIIKKHKIIDPMIVQDIYDESEVGIELLGEIEETLLAQHKINPS